MVGDADHGPDPPADAQPPAGRDHPAQRTKVRAAVAGAARGAVHARRLPGDHGQAHGAQVRQRGLRLPKIHPSSQSRYLDLTTFYIIVHVTNCAYICRCAKFKQPESCSRVPRAGPPDPLGLLRQLLSQRSGMMHHTCHSRAILPFINRCIASQDKFTQLLNLLPDLKVMAQRGEDFLYFKHMQGNAPHATLLMEMLHAKKR